ncbi:secreted RxLR effector protein 78-like [Lycium barbarum]|uniref:secreted RxLR effector protein 78-like n=1 Tax=Lycium barbarum TaxID=112863 RepID=UPI00293F61CE|nr:secreted RxLR effector protein 78-like [Lycium barbarum]
MKNIMPHIISDTQAGFIPGRRIADNIIMAHELVKWYARKNISARSMLKVDFQKAYDSVEWVFIEQVLTEMKFLAKFIGWIMCCMKTVSYSITINGVVTEPFEAAKGLRQGDPMSPYLFVIAMEYLSRLLNELEYNKQYKYHPKCAKVKPTHLSFEDDLLLFARGDKVSI